MADSALVTKYMQAYSGNYTKSRARYGKISEITVHHCAGGLSIEELGTLWQRKGREGSSHYGVCGNQVGQYVAEQDVAWTNSNWAANCRAVTIETSNSGGAPNWPVAADTLATLIKLVADVARRNGLHPLVLGKTLTWHSMYSATACPGSYLKAKLQYICDEANKLNNKKEDNMNVSALSPDAVTLQIGPASGGDRVAIKSLSTQLGIGYSEDTAGMMLVGPASPGDQSTVLSKAAALGLPYCIYKPTAGTEDGVKALTAKLADMTAQRDAAAQRAATAEKTAQMYLQRITAAQAALDA